MFGKVGIEPEEEHRSGSGSLYWVVEPQKKNVLFAAFF
jgi:hypothetical protein